MDGVLLTPLEARPAGVDLTALVTRVLAEVDQLRAEVAVLRRENLELRQQAGYWQSRHADAVRRIAALEQENEQLRGEVRKLQRLHAEFEMHVSSIASPIGKVKLLDVDDGTSNRYVPFEQYLKEAAQ